MMSDTKATLCAVTLSGKERTTLMNALESGNVSNGTYKGKALTAAEDIIAARVAAAFREAAEWLEDKPLAPVLTQRAKTIEWACDYIAERLRVRADDYDQSGATR